MNTAKYILTLISLLNLLKAYPQDTIYSDAYPNGIVVPTIDMDDFESRLHPINNPNLKLIIPKYQVIKITNAGGTKYVNSEYSKSSEIVIPTEQLTGKVNYVGIIEVPGTTKKTLFNALKTLPSANVRYFLVSSDESENTFLQSGIRTSNLCVVMLSMKFRLAKHLPVRGQQELTGHRMCRFFAIYLLHAQNDTRWGERARHPTMRGHCEGLCTR